MVELEEKEKNKEKNKRFRSTFKTSRCDFSLFFFLISDFIKTKKKRERYGHFQTQTTKNVSQYRWNKEFYYWSQRCTNMLQDIIVNEYELGENMFELLLQFVDTQSSLPYQGQHNRHLISRYYSYSEELCKYHSLCFNWICFHNARAYDKYFQQQYKNRDIMDWVIDNTHGEIIKIVLLGAPNTGKSSFIERQCFQSFYISGLLFTKKKIIFLKKKGNEKGYIGEFVDVVELDNNFIQYLICDTTPNEAMASTEKDDAAFSEFEKLLTIAHGFILLYSIDNVQSLTYVTAMFQRIMNCQLRKYQDFASISANSATISTDSKSLHSQPQSQSKQYRPFGCVLCANKHDLWFFEDFNAQTLNYEKSSAGVRQKPKTTNGKPLDRICLTQEGLQVAQSLGVAFIECSAHSDHNIDLAVQECLRDVWFREETFRDAL
ncbi:hypothetical protein RFI_08796 [Reticulomyxa filosa]|uniref:Uncharacterized protein n=1 Tax=Reticulomyxa filosa TaxID=46433 RepID=X6NPW2_RETFI|nr:hypothetical protein RFI_08796 [Reticulomyxa filosa]|eukprot:ETO28335.1 hypothetical protein RFI_08796 [Reticulomyxa filosa]